MCECVCNRWIKKVTWKGRKSSYFHTAAGGFSCGCGVGGELGSGLVDTVFTLRASPVDLDGWGCVGMASREEGGGIGGWTRRT